MAYEDHFNGVPKEYEPIFSYMMGTSQPSKQKLELFTLCFISIFRKASNFLTDKTTAVEKTKYTGNLKCILLESLVRSSTP